MYEKYVINVKIWQIIFLIVEKCVNKVYNLKLRIQIYEIMKNFKFFESLLELLWTQQKASNLKKINADG